MSHAPNMTERTELRVVGLIKNIYRQVDLEYSSWSEEYCIQAIQNLRQTPRPLPPLQQSSGVYNPAAHDNENNDNMFTITDFGKDCESTSSSSLPATTIAVGKVFRPYPPYDSCAPVSRNLMVGDDPDYLPFIPFLDDPAFEYSKYLEEYKYFRWQSESDSDCRRHFYLVYRI